MAGGNEVAKQKKSNDREGDVEKMSVVQIQAQVVANATRIASFRNRPMLMVRTPYPHFIPLRREKFDNIAYPLLGGVSRSRMGDVFAYVSNTAEDLTPYDNTIMFGLGDATNDGDMEEYYHRDSKTVVWDMDRLEFQETPDYATSIWRSPYGAISTPGPLPFIMSLAGNDQGVYDDIMQSLAPLVMSQKPDGVIWWIGDGANGKSTLMDAIYRIFPGQLSSITVKRLVDGRDTPSLNGTLANVVKESSEGRIEDTEIYKAIGTHENFRVHKFHSQDDMEIRGNLHHIFSGNSVPIFNDKGWSARRRTFIVPFQQRFESDPTFESRTFTPEFFGRLIMEMCKYAIKLREQGYKYKWSAETLAAKVEYDTDANNAEEFVKDLINKGVVAFDSFNPVRVAYENFCADHGYVPLGITNLRRAIGSSGFDRVSFRRTATATPEKIYRLKSIEGDAQLQPISLGMPGMYTIPGFQATPDTIEVPGFDDTPAEEEQVEDTDVPETPPTDEPPEPTEPQKPSVLMGKW